MEQIYEGHSIQCEAFAFTFVIGMPQYKFCLIWKCLDMKMSQFEMKDWDSNCFLYITIYKNVCILEKQYICSYKQKTLKQKAPDRHNQ